MKQIVVNLIRFIIRFYFFSVRLVTSNFIFKFFRECFNYSYLSYFGVETKFGYVNLVGLPIVRKYYGSRIIIGKGVTLVSDSRGNIAGVNHPVILATLSEGAVIQINDNVGISGSSICSVKKIIINNNSGLGVNSCIYDTDFHAIDFLSKQRKRGIDSADSMAVVIGKNVWIGANVLILKGVTVGDKAVIGAGAVVRKDVAASTLVYGNPAIEVRILI